MDSFKKLYGLYGFFKKNVRIVRIFSQKMYGLYDFFFKKCTDCMDLF